MDIFTGKKRMRILHFSDFHLNGKSMEEAKQILAYMKDALAAIQTEQKIDLVLFSGDMLDRGGNGFINLKDGFEVFHEEVITPLMESLELSESRFIFTPGNHDIDRNADNKWADDGIEAESNSRDNIVKLLKNPKIGEATHRMDAFKNFEKDYYSAFKDIKYNHNRFASTFVMDIDGVSVGIVSLNTVWRCGFDDAHKVALGINQITEQSLAITDSQLKIALTHYPIDFLKEFERVEVTQKCASHFDILFCGHSHRGYTLMKASCKEQAFLEVNTSGSLVGNVYEEKDKFKNAFQIIDCELGSKYLISTYRQFDSQEFSLDKNYGRNGYNELLVPNSEQARVLYEQQKQELEKLIEVQRRLNSHPFIPLQDFMNQPDNTVMQSEFVSCDAIDAKMNQLRTSERNCRLVALSGMGKTRIIIETFKDLDEVYYSDSPNCLTGLSYLLKNMSPKVVIIDNCDIKYRNDVEKCMEESGSHARLVTIYNVLTPEQTSTYDDVIKLEYSDTEKVIDKMIEVANIPQDQQYISQAIKDRSGNIPYMAVLLISAFKKNGTLHIENSDSVLSTILSGSEQLSPERYDVLRAISLFEPLGKDGGVSDEYEYVSHQYKLHNVNQQQGAVDNEFANTIHDFEQRQLMEHEGFCIRIRPRPLAEWLTESWLTKYEGKFGEVIDDIDKQEENLKNRLFCALKNRFKEMENSKYAQALFDKLNNLQTGAFHDERIAFSKAGSQLYLSMGVVSPVMVAKNLCDLLNSKDIEWLKNQLDSDARRNLVWALENICHSDLAFEDAGKSLARLAVAERENYANNATGLFVQLFHVYLSGTQANLKQRISLLQNLRNDEVYLPLLVKAIDNAFLTRHFYRSTTNGLADSYNDYQPQWGEIHTYWRDCAIVLRGILDQNEKLFGEVLKLVSNHIPDLARMGAKDILLDLLNFVGQKCNYNCMPIRDALAQYMKLWFEGPEDYRKDYQEMLDKFAPKSFYEKLSAFTKDNRCRIGKDYTVYAEKMTEQTKPLAQEFLDERIFDKDDFSLILQDKDLNNIWFVRTLADLTKNGDFQDELFEGMLKSVQVLPNDYTGNFIPTYIRIIGKNEMVLDFLDKVEKAGYYRLAASIIGVLDDGKYKGLSRLLVGYNEGTFDDECINQYLRTFDYQTIDDVFRIFDLLHENGVNEKNVGYPFLIDHVYLMNVDEIKEAGYLEKYKQILLAFDFKDSTRFLNRQVVEALEQIVSVTGDEHLAFNIHQLIMEVLSSLDYIDNPFDDVYFTLLPKYQNVILDDLLSKLGSDNLVLGYRISQYLNLGSGLELGKGPLFQCDMDKIKAACFKYPDYLPARLANMCPVYENSSDGRSKSFSEFFLWLCDNFGNQKEMLDEFSANMGTFSWCGINGYSDFIAERLPCIKPLLNHKNPTVREWAERQMNAVREEVDRERGIEAYEKMTRG